MKRILKNYQDGFSLIGIWPWTGVYAGATLILSNYTGLAGAALLTTVVFGAFAHIIEKKYPELNGLSWDITDQEPSIQKEDRIGSTTADCKPVSITTGRL